jgi:hypothetical protein
MLRMATVALACFAVAVVGVIALGDRTARADWNEYGKDWDESAPVQKSLGEDEGGLGDRMFHIEWSVTAAPDGRSEITGYVYNDEGEAADNVELRIIALDAAGRPVDSVVRPVRGEVPGLGRAFFDARVPASASYRVQVASFELEAGGGA